MDNPTNTTNDGDKEYLGEISGIPVIHDPKAKETHFRAPVASGPTPQEVPSIDDELDNIVVKLSCGAYNHGVYCEAKQIMDGDEKLTALENQAKQALKAREASIRKDELKEISWSDKLSDELKDELYTHHIKDRIKELEEQ